jgi:Zn-dependent M28 family amino/carboxypeptidase
VGGDTHADTLQDVAVKALVEALCSDRCAGRAAGTPGGAAARELVIDAFRDAGYDVELQVIPQVEGANVLARLPGRAPRFVLAAAHYDLVGRQGRAIYRGADDNAAAVAILVETARALKSAPPAGRGVIFAAFDAEEPPNFLSATMGSQHFVAHPAVPLDAIDLMVCLDLVGHALGPEGTPPEVRETVFALGAERSAGTAAHVDRLARATPGVVVRRVDVEAIPPLSDYHAFWQRAVPFVFLSNGRSRVYHTPDDTPDRLDFAKMAATAEWLTRFVRETCERTEPRIQWTGAADDAATLRTLAEIARALEAVAPEARRARAGAERLLAACDARGVLPDRHRGDLFRLVATMEGGLA